MKKTIIISIYAILGVILLKIVLNMILNSILISKYNNNEYSVQLASFQTFVNFPERYVPLYNYGNVLYQKGEYENAIEMYDKALNTYVPKGKECNIRINYALAICKLVKVDENNEDSIQEAIKQYESAISVLIEQECATENGDGHNENAETLKKDIEKEIERLKKLLNKSDEEQSEEEEEEKKEEKQNNSNNNKKEESIEKKLQEIKEEAMKKQQDADELYSNKTFSVDFYGKNW